MRHKTNRLFATFFYVGDFPVAPGSLASVAGVMIYIAFYGNPVALAILTVMITIIGFLVSGATERHLNLKDPSCVVIDEVAGVLIAFFMLPLYWPIIVTAFFLFRAFDMFKIYPVNKFEEFGGSVGIMTDDIVAGIYTNLIMHAAIRLAGIV